MSEQVGCSAVEPCFDSGAAVLMGLPPMAMRLTLFCANDHVSALVSLAASRLATPIAIHATSSPTHHVGCILWQMTLFTALMVVLNNHGGKIDFSTVK